MIRAALRLPRTASAAAVRSETTAASSFHGNGSPRGSTSSATGWGSGARSHGFPGDACTGGREVAGGAVTGAGSATSTGVGCETGETGGSAVTARGTSRGWGAGTGCGPTASVAGGSSSPGRGSCVPTGMTTRSDGSTVGGVAGAGTGGGGRAGDGTGGSVDMGGGGASGGRNRSGSRYPCGSVLSRIPSCTYGTEWAGTPLVPTTATAWPSATTAPRPTKNEPRCRSVTV
jgi:hypothetical protein